MKRFLLLLTIMASTLLFSEPLFAEWSVSAVDSGDRGKLVLTITLISDGDAASFNLLDELNNEDKANAQGRYIYKVITNPDDTAAPDATYTLTITNSLGETYTLTDRSTSATEDESGYDISSSGALMTIYDDDLDVAITDLGSSGDTIVLILELI